MLRQGVMVIRYSVDEDGVSAGGALFFFVCSAVMAITIHVNAVLLDILKKLRISKDFS